MRFAGNALPAALDRWANATSVVVIFDRSGRLGPSDHVRFAPKAHLRSGSARIEIGQRRDSNSQNWGFRIMRYELTDHEWTAKPSRTLTRFTRASGALRQPLFPFSHLTTPTRRLGQRIISLYTPRDLMLLGLQRVPAQRMAACRSEDDKFRKTGSSFHGFVKSPQQYARITIRWKLDLILLSPLNHTSSIRAAGVNFATSP
jgi:hypothetical protein